MWLSCREAGSMQPKYSLVVKTLRTYYKMEDFPMSNDTQSLKEAYIQIQV